MTLEFSPDEETTSTGRLRIARQVRPPVSEAVVPGADLYESVGKLMAATARIESRINDLAPLASEVRHLREDIERDRGVLVHDTSKSAARHSSNRMAALVSALFVAYEAAAPVLHEIWKGLHS